MEQLAPAARFNPQLFPNTKEEASAPVTAILEIGSLVPPVLVKVTDFDALPDPTRTVPNDRLLAERDAFPGVSPVPLSAIDCGDPVALSEIVMAAVNGPGVAGVK
jgi:hypothetical protein